MRIELGHHLVGRDAITPIYRALDDPATDPEGESDFLFRLDLSCQNNCLAQAALFDDDRAHRARGRRLFGDIALATGEHWEERQSKCQHWSAGQMPARARGA